MFILVVVSVIAVLAAYIQVVAPELLDTSYPAFHTKVKNCHDVNDNRTCCRFFPMVLYQGTRKECKGDQNVEVKE